jgi:hypothetical protein
MTLQFRTYSLTEIHAWIEWVAESPPTTFNYRIKLRSVSRMTVRCAEFVENLDDYINEVFLHPLLQSKLTPDFDPRVAQRNVRYARYALVDLAPAPSR